MTPETARLYAAAHAMAGILASRSPDWDIGDDKGHTAREAVQYADALIKALAAPVQEKTK